MCARVEAQEELKTGTSFICDFIDETKNEYKKMVCLYYNYFTQQGTHLSSKATKEVQYITTTKGGQQLHMSPRNSAQTKLAQIRKDATVLYTIVGGPVVVGGASEGGVGRGWEVTGLASSPSVCATPSEFSSTPSSAPLGWLNCFHFSWTVCVICRNKGTGVNGENQSRENGNIRQEPLK